MLYFCVKWYKYREKFVYLQSNLIRVRLEIKRRFYAYKVRI